MAAANTDKLRKKKNLFSTTLSSGISDSDTSLSCASLSGVPTDTAVTVTVDRVDANGASTPSLREDITGVVSGNNLTNLVRGEGATTAQAHANAAVVEITWETETWNDAVDAILVAHNQDGTHKSGSVLTLPQINDTSSDHQYVVAVSELAADRTITLPLLGGNDEFVFKDHAQTLTNKTLDGPKMKRSTSLQVFDGVEDVTTGDGKAYFTIPEELDGANLTGVHARVITAGTTGTTDIQIRNVTDSVDMLSTKLKVDSGETGSDTATPAVIDTTKDDVATNDLVAIDVDATSTTKAKGLVVRLQFLIP